MLAGTGDGGFEAPPINQIRFFLSNPPPTPTLPSTPMHKRARTNALSVGFPQERVASFFRPGAKEQWGSMAELDDARTRFRVMFNDKSTTADPLSRQLRMASNDVSSWMSGLRNRCNAWPYGVLLLSYVSPGVRAVATKSGCHSFPSVFYSMPAVFGERFF